MSYIVALIVIVGLIFAYFYRQAGKEIAEENEREILQIVEKVNNRLSKIQSVKTTSSKINNCEKALDLLKQADRFPGCRKVITNYDELVDKIERIKKVLPVGKYIEKAQKHNFKGKDSSEKNSLLDALYEIRTKNITNEDFEIAELHDDQTGEIVTIEMVENRLYDLGWEGDSKITR